MIITSEVTNPFSMKLNGEVTHITDNTQLKFNAKWTDLQWPLVGESDYSSKMGEVKIHGSLSDFVYSLDAHFQGLNIPQIDLHSQGKGHGDKDELEINQLKLNTLGGEITGKALLNYRNGIHLTTSLQGHRINPSRFWDAPSSRLNFSINTQHELTNRNYKHVIKLNSLSGSLSDNEINGSGEVSIKNNSFTFKNLNITAGNERIFLNGGLDKQWDLRWNIRLSDLGLFIPDSSGRINSQGTIKGSRLAPRAEIDLNADHVKYKQYQFDELKIGAHGTLDKNKLTILLTEDQQRLSLQAQGAYIGQSWHGELSELNFSSPGVGSWHLKSKTPIQLSGNNIQIDHLCWQSALQHICINGNWHKDNPWALQVESSRLTTQFFASLYPENVSLDSTFSVNATFKSDSAQRLVGNAEFKLYPGLLKYELYEKTNEIRVNGGTLKAKIDNKGLTAHLLSTLDSKNDIDAKITLPGYNKLILPKPSQKLSAQAHVLFDQLDLIQFIFPEVANVKGFADINFTLKGTIENPIFVGTAKIKNSSLEIPMLNIQLKEINFNAKGDAKGNVNYAGSAKSGGGQINLNGDIQLLEKGHPSKLNINGANFQAINTNEYNVFVTPKLSITRKNQRIDFNGDILITEASLNPKNLGTTVSMPNETIFVDRGRLVTPDERLKIHSNIHLRLSNKVYLRFLGLTGRIAGDLILKDTPDRPTMASGSLKLVEGYYRSYNQKLDIEKGVLSFAGTPVTNPSLDIKAGKTVIATTRFSDLPTMAGSSATAFSDTNRDVARSIKTKIGVSITGVLQQPIIKLYSDPANLSQSEILSFLILGSSIEQAAQSDSKANSQRLLGAASALNIGGTNVKQEIQSTFGIDELEIESKDKIAADTNEVEQHTSLILGKALSPKLYINFGFDFFDSAPTFKIRYIISRRFTLQTDTNPEAVGVDLLYTYERE